MVTYRSYLYYIASFSIQFTSAETTSNILYDVDFLFTVSLQAIVPWQVN